MVSVNDIYDAIDANGFKESTLKLIDEYINDIENGRANFSRFNEQEHAGLCRQVRLSLGRPSSQATRAEALQQVAMLKAAKEAHSTGK